MDFLAALKGARATGRRIRLRGWAAHRDRRCPEVEYAWVVSGDGAILDVDGVNPADVEIAHLLDDDWEIVD